MYKVLLADDHAIVREGVKQVLADSEDFVVVAEAQTQHDVLEKTRRAKPDVVLLDISMPSGNIFDLIAAIKREWPKLPILVLSMHREEEYGIRVLRVGAAGYVMKDAAPTEVLRALRKVLSGGKYLSANLADQLVAGVQNEMRPIHELLSDREYAVFRLIATGRAVKEIADELSLSMKTISTYRSRIIEKTGLKTNADMVRYAIGHRLVE